MKVQKNKNYIKKTLSNGIDVFFYVEKKLKRTFISYNVCYGSNGYYSKFIYDNKECSVNPGMAHFLEHTLIEHSSYGNMLHKYFSKHYEFNGQTGDDMTTFYFIGLNKIEESLEELIKMVDEPVFTREDVEEVKAAVCEELKNIDSNKYRIAFSQNRRNAFSNYESCPKCNNILGTVDTTMNITYEDAKLCYDAYYYDKNKFLVIGGNVNIEKYMKLLEKIYSKIKRHESKLIEYPYSDDFKVRKLIDYIKWPSDNDVSIITYKIKIEESNYSYINKIGFYISILNDLKFSPSTKFVEKHNKSKLLIGNIGNYTNYFKGVITNTLIAETTDTDKIFKEINNTIKNLKDLSKKDFELIKKRLIVRELQREDYLYSSFHELSNKYPISTSFNEIECINSLNYEEMIEYLSKLSLDTYTITIIEN